MNKKNNYIIEVKNLGKTYKIYNHPSQMLKEFIFHKNYHRDFDALKNINFTIKRGEVVGIIGRNGSGKSTLLKIIAGTLDKTAGGVRVNGKVSAILDLGLGFHPEYTGRENIYNGAMILGMKKGEIDRKIDSIIDFSELEDFIDQPFKTYSSGMMSRLLFSVATAVEPEILIIDEALAAGDMFFTTKCMDRMTKMCRSGATVLFVSHALPLVQKLCQRVIYLEKGELIKDGPALEVCQIYENSVMEETSSKLRDENVRQGKIIKKKKDDLNDSTVDNPSDLSEKRIWKKGPIDITKVRILNNNNQERYSFYQNDQIILRVHYKTTKPLNNVGVLALFTRTDGVYATSFISTEPYQELGELKDEGFINMVWDKILLGEGFFLITVGLYPYRNKMLPSTIQSEAYIMHDKCVRLEIKRKGWPLQTVYDQPVKISHHPKGK